jgi:hypothetical protein
MNHKTASTAANAIKKYSPVKKLKASKECGAPMIHSSRFAKPRIPIYYDQNMYRTILESGSGWISCMHAIFIIRLPNVIKGTEAKMQIRAIMIHHRIKVHTHHAIVILYQESIIIIIS